MRCISCGRRMPVIEYLCEECYLQRHAPRLPDQISITKCKRCGMVRQSGRWVEESDIQEKVLIPFKSNLFFIKDARMENGSLRVILMTEKEGICMQVERCIPLRVEYTVCPSCSRVSGGYYEATIQIRGDDAEGVASEIKMMIEGLNEPDAFITKEIVVRGGKDILVGSWRAAERISRDIASRRGAEFKSSKKLHTRQEGRNVYRMSYLIRLPKIKSGDIFEYDDAPFVFLSVVDKGTVAQNLASGVRTRIPVPANNLEPITSRSDVREAIIVSETENDLHVLEPESMRPIDISKPHFLRGRRSLKDTVKVVKIKGEWWIYPDSCADE